MWNYNYVHNNWRISLTRGFNNDRNENNMGHDGKPFSIFMMVKINQWATNETVLFQKGRNKTDFTPSAFVKA